MFLKQIFLKKIQLFFLGGAFLLAIFCIINLQKIDFKSKEAEHLTDSSSTDLLEKTPIDVVYLYHDAEDDQLEENKTRIEKEFDNDEFRYSIRSVIENAPWIRKIFIITKNKKIRFLKDDPEVNDRIVLIDQNALLPEIPTKSCITVEHSGLHKLDEFGVSEFFLYFSDDYFLQSKVSKSDFFYVKNNEVFPFVLYGDTKLLKKNYKEIKSLYDASSFMLEESAKEHTGECYSLQTRAAEKFLFEALEKKELILTHNLETQHNVVGFKIRDLKEIHDIIKSKYKYQKELFESFERNNKQFTYETFCSFYLLNKKKRMLNTVSHSHVDVGCIDVMSYNYNRKRISINTGSFSYHVFNYTNAKTLMLKLFPNPSPYELSELEDGEYKIRNSNTSLFMTLKKDNKVKFEKDQNSDLQKFKITKKDGVFTIENKFLNETLDFQPDENVSFFSKETNHCTQKYYISTFKDKKSFFIASKFNNLLLKNRDNNLEIFAGKYEEERLYRFDFIKLPEQKEE